MRKKSLKHNAAARRRRLLLFVAVAVVIAAAAITVISRQKGRTTQAAETAQAAAPTARTFVTRRVGNQDVHIDTQSGEIKPLTAEEAQKLANGLAPMLDNSTDGLTQVQHVDGSVSMNLEGRFQNVTVARVNDDGTIDQSCVDNPRAAAKFFRMDPKLIERAPTARRRANKN